MKHDQLYILASAKLASMNLILAKTLHDGRIDDIGLTNLHTDESDVDDYKYKRQKRVIEKVGHEKENMVNVDFYFLLPN